MSARLESHFRFGRRRESQCSRPSMFFVVVGNSTAVMSIRKLISRDCLRTRATSGVS